MNKFLFKWLPYEEDPVLTAYLKECLKSGILEVKQNSSYIEVIFGDLTRGVFNPGINLRYWLSDGALIFVDDQSYNWMNTRPSKKVMSKLLKKLK